ncbi:MAG: flagellar biosynthesis protein FlhA [bacterium]|jgi:flagellar biosynthesis protein FlhA|nr:flagellar biosynthesis protein FlhA [Planctomycetota bacterium]HIL52409.1 flagellar biosynthesis protein FlhA [Planctomycetota bacterium]
MSEQQTTSAQGAQSFGRFLRNYADWVMGIGVLGLMVTLITPLSPGVLDILLATNITISLLLLMVTMNAGASTELSTFPTILLFATLFRLGLNVASTRLILTGGGAGSIITAFGNYVAGENLTVGMVVFLILIIIQFVVITKGSGRISEVSARFVLDAMPGKQMAIDADLNAGLIDSTEAKERRAEIATEAEFYGSMDGASKFVRGDAIAGLIITALNLIGGITIGSLGGMGLAEAGERFSKLTIGDGLVSQIPALFISTSAAVLVTKNSGKGSLSQSLFAQVGGKPKATIIAAGMMFFMGLLPGMPRLPFFVLATALVLLWRSTRSVVAVSDLLVAAEGGAAEIDTETEESASEQREERVEELLQVDRVSLEIGYRLIPLVQDENGDGILDHIAQLRRRFATNDGIVLPPVRIKDNIRLAPGAYRVLVGGEEVASGEIEPSYFLAMDGGTASGPIQGKETRDPAFGLPAWWIAEEQRDEAELLGYTVIDPTSVLVTHLSETIRRDVADVLTRDDVKELVESVKRTSPTVVEELIPERMGYGEVQCVLRNLLRESVPIRNMPAILEVLADNVRRTQDPEALTELVRQRLGRSLCEQHTGPDGTLHAVTLDPEVEARIANAVGTGNQIDVGAISPAYLQRLMERMGEAIAQATRGGNDVVLLVRSSVRRFLNELVRSSLPKVSVLSYNEVVPARAVETAAVIKMEE